MTLGKRPPTGAATQIWRPNTGQDPARYLVPDANLRHRRPQLAAGKLVFTWPIGVEGFARSGRATLGIHHYIGDHVVDVQVMHRDEARIELRGTFPGITATENMIDLIQVLTAKPHPDRGLTLYMPGIFERIQYVIVEDYNFNHNEDDRTHSIEYTITMVRIGVGKKAKDPKGRPPVPNPLVRVRKKGKAKNKITVRDHARTMRAIAKIAYGDDRLWKRIAEKNRFSPQLQSIPSHQLPNYHWPIGTSFEI